MVLSNPFLLFSLDALVAFSLF